MIHGAAAAELCATVSRTVFDKKVDAHALADDVFATLAAEMPSARVPRTPSSELDVVALLEQAFTLSKTAVRKLIQQGAVSVNGTKLGADQVSVPSSDAVRGRWLLVRKGGRDIAIGEVA